ncbi:MAG TPA: ScyD/ScyE family protein [Pseudonocardiaceae bacterium]
MSRTGSVAAVAAAFILTVSMSTPAAAATVSEPIIDGLTGPLGLAVGSDGTVYVTQSSFETFTGTLTAVGKKGTTDLVSASGATIDGVDAIGKGNVTYATIGFGEGGFFAEVRRVQPNGTVRVVADTLAFEAANNPDQVNSYGFQGLTADCAAQVAEAIPDDPGHGEPYAGLVDSHPYGVALMPDGSTLVADAGGNDLIRIDEGGGVSALAVFPPQPVEITAEIAAAMGVPCVAGSTYNFEPVPTDVELGPDGLLYVTLLPGGPENPSLGARGAVYSVDPDSGDVDFVARGFLGATGLAVAPDGTIYVAELFGNRISTVSGTGAEPFVDVPLPAAVEWANGRLYATIDVFGNGSVVTITP